MFVSEIRVLLLGDHVFLCQPLLEMQHRLLVVLDDRVGYQEVRLFLRQVGEVIPLVFTRFWDF